MSGGISAIKGFDYQAAVILELLLEHFRKHPEGRVRPEGLDDLDLYTSRAAEGVTFVQIKKPTENVNGELTPSPWTLHEAARHLMSPAVVKLLDGKSRQIWVLGDESTLELKQLIDAGAQAPTECPASYWLMVLLITRQSLEEDGLPVEHLPKPNHKLLKEWTTRHNSDIPFDWLDKKISSIATQQGASQSLVNIHAEKLSRYASSMPHVLERITLRCGYGSEQEVNARVKDKLSTELALSAEVVNSTLYFNLRSFINEISKKPGQCFSRDDFEAEVRCVWPHMSPICTPPALPRYHIARVDITRPLMSKPLTEVIGVSGSGKTYLATETYHLARKREPGSEIYYVEVRQDTSLRSVLAGISFHLRRIGIRKPFTIVTRAGETEQERISQLAAALSESSARMLFLIDIVDGTCGPLFKRELSSFIKALQPGAVSIIFFSQESPLLLSNFERKSAQVATLNLRGFTYEEFSKLVSRYHANSQSWPLYRIFRRITAGRESGLFATLADTLARASTLDEMQMLAAQEPEDILPTAERIRFANISSSARPAAERLICFALPFDRSDAKEIFPKEPVALAISEMLELGLLRTRGDGLLEMHEVVRAGLEENIPVDTRRCAHQTLATWYGSCGVVSAEIFHLDKANLTATAQARAKQAFLKGLNWNELASFVLRRKLISAEEVITTFAQADKAIEHCFILPDLLRALDYNDANALIAVLKERIKHRQLDYQFDSAITEAIMQIDPGKVEELIALIVDATTDEVKRKSAFSTLSSGIRKFKFVLSEATLCLFDAQSFETQRSLLGIFSQDKRVDTLSRVFQVHAEELRAATCDEHVSPLHLKIATLEDAKALIAALPSVSTQAMLISKSALLGPLVDTLRPLRVALKRHSIEILRQPSIDPGLHANAIRVISLFADRNTPALCHASIVNQLPMAAFHAVIPALMPSLCERGDYESVVLNPLISIGERRWAMTALALLGVDLEETLYALAALPGQENTDDQWELYSLMTCSFSPFKGGIALLRKFFEANPGTVPIALTLGPLLKLSELDTPDASALLAMALASPHREVRRLAAMRLQYRRDSTVLAPMIQAYRKEQDTTTALYLARAIVASGAKNTGDLDHDQHQDAAFMVWRCILARRSKDEWASALLVKLALDNAQPWKVRRAAIAAAGELPYDTVLSLIQTTLLTTALPLVDHSVSLSSYLILSFHIEHNARLFLQWHSLGRITFIELVGSLVDREIKDIWFSENATSGATAAEWLYNSLSRDDRTASYDLAAVENAIHLPLLQLATIQSLRKHGKIDIIEALLKATTCEWLRIHATKQLVVARGGGSATESHLRHLLGDACSDHSFLGGLLPELCSRKPASSTHNLHPPSHRPLSNKSQGLAASTIMKMVQEDTLEKALPQDFIITDLSQTQLVELIPLLDPERDPSSFVSEFQPVVGFTSDGHYVAQESSRSRPSSNARSRLRAALAAANDFDVEINWHGKSLSTPYGTEYRIQYLHALVLRGNSQKFYNELDANHDTLLIELLENGRIASLSSLLDDRIIPLISPYIEPCNLKLFLSLCNVAALIQTPSIDATLKRLTYRWAREFTAPEREATAHNEQFLHQGFHLLVRHPRFIHVDGIYDCLASVHRHTHEVFSDFDLPDIFEHHPRAYVDLESRLADIVEFEHYQVSRYDKLDDRCAQLFSALDGP
ncbi:ATP-binding protein [Pseudomonas koreensis]